MKVRAYPIIAEAVESGVNHGISRAYKHTDQPSHENMTQSIVDAVMLALNEVIDWEDDFER